MATMAGAVAGALYGVDNIPREYISMIDRVNKFDLEGLAHDIERIFY